MDESEYKGNSKTWCFTLHNYTDKDELLIQNWEGISLLKYGHEVCPTTGTPHLQGTVIFKKAFRFSTLKKWHDSIHWKHCKSTDASFNYCTKDKDYVVIDNRHQGKRNDLTSMCNYLKSGGNIDGIVNDYSELYVKYSGGVTRLKDKLISPRNFKTTVVWIEGIDKPLEDYCFHDIEDTYYCSNTSRWWEDYEYQKNVVIYMSQEFADSMYLFRLFGSKPFNVETKGSSRRFVSKNIYVFSEYTPYHYRDHHMWSGLIDRVYSN